jgi:hypothetical protein
MIDRASARPPSWVCVIANSQANLYGRENQNSLDTGGTVKGSDSTLPVIRVQADVLDLGEVRIN